MTASETLGAISQLIELNNRVNKDDKEAIDQISLIDHQPSRISQGIITDFD